MLVITWYFLFLGGLSNGKPLFLSLFRLKTPKYGSEK